MTRRDPDLDYGSPGDCAREGCDGDAYEALWRKSPREATWLCPSCLTEFGEWVAGNA